MTIANDQELEAAIDRIQELTGAPEDTPEAMELEQLADAVEAYREGQQ